MRRADLKNQRRAAGFTLFEMVISIIAIVILYMVAEQRLNELPAAAERANFYAVLEQLKTGVRFSMLDTLTTSGTGEVNALAEQNPMSLLLETPSNYRGEMFVVTDNVPYRNSWYFETSTNELVYVVGGSSVPDVVVHIGGIPTMLGQIRFRIGNRYSQDANRQGQTWEGVSLAQVYDYTWRQREEMPIELN